jgi:hypothetical protein
VFFSVISRRVKFPIIFTIKKFLKTQKLKFHEEKKKRQTCFGSKFFDSEDEELFFSENLCEIVGFLWEFLKLKIMGNKQNFDDYFSG